MSFPTSGSDSFKALFKHIGQDKCLTKDGSNIVIDTCETDAENQDFKIGLSVPYNGEYFGI